MWGCRGLTLAGRMLIFKSLALSKVLYTCTMTNFTKDFIKQLEDLRKNFIWNGRRPKIKHSALIGDHVDGGYKDVDMETKLSSPRTIWIRRFLDNSFHAWKAIPYSLLSILGSHRFSISIPSHQYFVHRKCLTFLSFISRWLHCGKKLVTKSLIKFLRYLINQFGTINIY